MSFRTIAAAMMLVLLSACNGGGVNAPLPAKAGSAPSGGRGAQAAATTPFEINAGGAAVGNYVADTAFTGGAVSRGTTAAISTAGVTDPAPMQVYQSGRIDIFNYTYTGLTPGAVYTVRLHFAEYIYAAAGLRQFNVAINGTRVLTNFDIYAAAGGEYKAVVKQFSQTADSSGNIAIAFTVGAAGGPMVQGLELVPTATPTPTAGSETDINAGGPLAGSYVADTDYSGGNLSSGTTHAIDTSAVTNPAPMQVYQSGRINNFTYTFSGLTPSTTYTVRLHFDEYSFNGPGLRKFNVAINGTNVLSNFDIYAAAGAQFKAVVKQFSVPADSTGKIAIAFTNGAAASAIVQGLQLLSPSGTPPTPTPTPSPTPAPQAGDQLTYHVDNMRTGWNQNETVLTTTNVASSSFTLRQNIAVDGVVMAQPLYVSQYQINGGTHNMLIVATEHNSVYAFDADTAAQLWHVNLGKSQSSADVSCGDIQPEYGITGTPVIVRSGAGSGTIYLVSATEPTSMSFHTMLHALNLTNGTDATTPVEISPSAVLTNGSTIKFSAQHQMERTGLLWANNSLYVGIGSHCDAAMGSTTGWILRYSASLGLMNQFNTVDDSAAELLASVWMTGYAPAADSSGNIYFVTGNGAYDANTGGKNYGQSVVKLSPSLGVLSEFTPSTWSSDNTGDHDLGSGGTMLLPNSGDLVAMGKDAKLFLLSQASLGGESSTNSGALQATQLTGNTNYTERGVWGGPAYYSGPSGAYVYYQLDYYPVQQFRFSGGLSLAATGTSSAGYGGSSPVVSSNGQTAGTAIVWLAQRGTGVTLQAYDATNVATMLTSKSAGTWNNTANNPFVTPLVANGRVYVGSAGNVAVFGIAPLGTAAVKPMNTVAGGMKSLLHVHGHIAAVQGTTLTLKRRTGQLLSVDIASALQRGTTGVLALDRPVVVWGTRDARGAFHADNLSDDSPNPSNWGGDSF